MLLRKILTSLLILSIISLPGISIASHFFAHTLHAEHGAHEYNPSDHDASQDHPEIDVKTLPDAILGHKLFSSHTMKISFLSTLPESLDMKINIFSSAVNNHSPPAISTSNNFKLYLANAPPSLL